MDRIRLAVVDTNARVATTFWERMGFAATGEQKPYRYDKLESTSRLMEKPVLPAEDARSVTPRP